MTLIHKLMGNNSIGIPVVEWELQLQEQLFRKCGCQVIIFEIEKQLA